jgi:hypothetical protein
LKTIAKLVPRPGVRVSDDAGSLVNAGKEKIWAMMRQWSADVVGGALTSILAIDLAHWRTIHRLFADRKPSCHFAV